MAIPLPVRHERHNLQPNLHQLVKGGRLVDNSGVSNMAPLCAPHTKTQQSHKVILFTHFQISSDYRQYVLAEKTNGVDCLEHVTCSVRTD